MASLVSCNMFSVSPKALLLVLVCSFAASAADTDGGAPRPRDSEYGLEAEGQDGPSGDEEENEPEDEIETGRMTDGRSSVFAYFARTAPPIELKPYLDPDPVEAFYMWSDVPELDNSAGVWVHDVTIRRPDVTELNNSARVRVRNVTIRRPEMSEEALLFLTGPVSTVLIPSFYMLVCLISVPINICAVLAFARKIRPKKPAAIYMLNLACADLLFAALLPFKIAYHFGGNNWIFGPVMCRVVTAAFYWNMYCSVLIITCISVDRLLAVVYPIDSLSWRRPQNAIIACVTMWILSLAGSVPLVLTNQTVHLSELNITTCHDVQQPDVLIWHYKIYFITLCCILFFLPLLITVVSYARVIWSLSRVPQGVPKHSRRRTRAVVMALTVLVIFLLCFTPTNCLLLVYYLQINEGLKKSREGPDGSYAAYLVFLCLGSLNCLLDPVVYCFGSSQCQKQLSKALRCQKITKGSSSNRS